MSGEIEFYWWLVATFIQFYGWKLIFQKTGIIGTDALTHGYTDKGAFSSKDHVRNYFFHYSKVVRCFVLQWVMPNFRESVLEIMGFPSWPIILSLPSLKLKMRSSWSLFLFFHIWFGNNFFCYFIKFLAHMGITAIWLSQWALNSKFH